MTTTRAVQSPATSRPLKDLLDARLVRDIASELSRADPTFDAGGFVERGLDGLDRLELTERAWHLADALWWHLPQPFARVADVLVDSLGPELAPTEIAGLASLRYMPHVFFVQRYGLDDFETAMRAQYELTKRFSAESSIRAFLVRYPEETYGRLLEWARDENVHVRRLVSEGTRPRLPWAPRLRAYQEDPRPVIALLEMLKDDPERYVQRSVANNLNDIAKDHPGVVVHTVASWLLESNNPHAPWIAKRALRHLVKQGHAGALAALGFKPGARAEVTSLELDEPVVAVGAALGFNVTIIGHADERLNVDYAVTYQMGKGKVGSKVFKLKALDIRKGERVTLSKRHSFRPITTRTYHPGEHRVTVLANGHPAASATFELRS